MHSETIFLVLFVTFISVLGLTTKAPTPPCPTCLLKDGPPYRHYSELGCKPNFNGKCIDRYDCPILNNPQPIDKCNYRNKLYNIGDNLPSNMTSNNCLVGCVCSEGSEGSYASFSCATIDCPFFFEDPDPPKNCINQFSLDSCCPVKEVCEPKEIAALKNCTWDSTVYREGQRFDPSGTCQMCICGKGFKGVIKPPFCKPIDCGTGLLSANQALAKCAPIYFQDRYCCPIGWQCPSAADKIVRKPVGKNPVKKGMKCKYGDQLLNIGDTVQGEDACVTCSCNMPPLLNCIRKDNCP